MSRYWETERNEIHKKVKNPFSLKSPEYHEKGSTFAQAGTDYGVGYSASVGHEGKAKSEGIPSKSFDTDISVKTPKNIYVE